MNLETVRKVTKKIIKDKKYYLLPIIPFMVLIFAFTDNTYYNKKNPIKGFVLAIIINALIFLTFYFLMSIWH